MKNQLTLWKRVFSNWNYLILGIIIALLFYSLNVIIADYKTLFSFYSSLGFLGTINFFFSLLIGFKETIKMSSYISLLVISLLLGMLTSLIFYKANVIKGNSTKNIGLISGIGIILGAFIPGCAACGIGLASALGIGGAFLTFLPLKGLELSILSILILTIAIFKISEDSCKIMFNKKMKGGRKE